MEADVLTPTEMGSPQGGAISPLLANIALHGLETAIRDTTPKGQTPPQVIRYADDFVVLHSDRTAVERAQHTASAWLAGMGLELKPSKTRIGHTFQMMDGTVGFDFLGFTVRQFPVGQTHQGKMHTGYKTLIKPSKTAQQRHLADLTSVIDRHQQRTQRELVFHLNRKIRGWAEYHSRQVAKQVFGRMDHLLFLKLQRWAYRRHPNKSRSWVTGHYWHTRGDRHWVFGPRDGTPLLLHMDTPIRRHIKVKGDASPYNGDILYWATRLGQHPELPASKARLLKQQQGRCAYCGLLFTNIEELIEDDHRIPARFSGRHGTDNRQLLHGHCHDQKTAQDGSLYQRGQGGIHDKDQDNHCRGAG